METTMKTDTFIDPLKEGWRHQRNFAKAGEGTYAIMDTMSYGDIHYVRVYRNRVHEWGHETGESRGQSFKEYAGLSDAFLFCGVTVQEETHPLSELGVSREGRLVEIAQPLPNDDEQRTLYILWGDTLVPWRSSSRNPEMKIGNLVSLDPARLVVFRDVVPDGRMFLPTPNMRKTDAEYEGFGEWKPIRMLPNDNKVYERKSMFANGKSIGTSFISVADGWVYEIGKDSDYCQPYEKIINSDDRFITSVFREARLK